MRRSLLARTPRLFLLGTFFCLPVSLEPTASRGYAADETTQKEIARLIDDLGSGRFEVREAATHRLAEMEESKPALLEAQKSRDAEVRRRVKSILLALQRRHALRSLPHAYALGKAGRAIEAVDQLVKWGNWDTTGEGWDSLLSPAWKTPLLCG